MTDRDAWLIARRQGIGGSDAAALMACHPYHSLVSLWADKTGRLPPDEDNLPMRWGRRLESAILDEYAYATGLDVVAGLDFAPERAATFDGDVRMLRHPTLPVMIGNVDGVAVGDASGPGVVDAKAVTPRKFRKWIADGRPDLNYLVQLDDYMELLDLEWACIAAFTSIDSPVFVYNVERDRGFGARLMEAADTFWRRYVLADREPPADSSEATAKALRAIHPKDNGEAVLLTGPATEWAAEHDDLADQIRVLKERRDKLTTKLIATIGDASAGILPDGSGFTYKAGKTGRSLRRAAARGLRKYTPK